MTDYEGLTIYLLKRREAEFIITFDEIETMIGSKLPKTAERPQYWANVKNELQRNPPNKAARNGGYSSFLIKGADKVRFVRD